MSEKFPSGKKNPKQTNTNNETSRFANLIKNDFFC